ncbi:OLC1v1004637C2 [Oldenlandia corymbosa var. corymbosa]|uniref:OLC1v1004637C2 n=1 Tax=Oldenlandia corymbosa var. corymbosa TaxID=529605 RepID=A0AAV1DCR9_OLDCO|nr:OLC1v1004637C2 [Oldenlandia corymbosa var. corymbosa]
MAFSAIHYHGSLLPSPSVDHHQQTPNLNHISTNTIQVARKEKLVPQSVAGGGQHSKKTSVKCNVSLEDFIGGDLIKFDLGQWLSDVEEHKALAIYPPHEGGYEGRYFIRLRQQGYHFLDLTAKGLGDPETTLIKFHPVCPPHIGKQPIARWYYPPEIDFRLSMLPPNAKGLVLYLLDAKVKILLFSKFSAEFEQSFGIFFN